MNAKYFLLRLIAVVLVIWAVLGPMATPATVLAAPAPAKVASVALNAPADAASATSCLAKLNANSKALVFPEIKNTMDSSGGSDLNDLVYAEDAGGSNFVAAIQKGNKLTFESIKITGKQ